MATTTADNIQSSVASIPTRTCTRAIVNLEGAVLGAESFSTHPSRLPGDASLVPLSWRAASCRSGIHRYLRSRHHPAPGTLGYPRARGDRAGPASRRAKGKDDALDAIAAAEAARTRRRVQVAKDRSGAVEALRVLRMTRETAIKCRRAALQQLHNTIVAAPEEVRDQVRNLTRMQRLRTCAGMEAGHGRLSRPGGRDQARPEIPRPQNPRPQRRDRRTRPVHRSPGRRSSPQSA